MVEINDKINAKLIKELIENGLNDNDAKDGKNKIPFDCELEFQLALAMKLKQENPDIKIKFEKNIYVNSKARCDIVIEYNKDNKEEKILLELKYKCREDQDKSSYDSRKSFIEDMQRLYDCMNGDEDVKKYCIFITNKTAVYNNKHNASGEVKLFNSTFGKEEKGKESKWNEYDGIYFLIVEVSEKGECVLVESEGTEYKGLKFKVIKREKQ